MPSVVGIVLSDTMRDEALKSLGAYASSTKVRGRGRGRGKGRGKSSPMPLELDVQDQDSKEVAAPTSSDEAKIKATLIEHDRLRKNVEVQSYPEVEVKYDEDHGCNFFLNVKTGQRGWQLQDVLALEATATEVDVLDKKMDDIIEKYDQARNRPYFVNRKTGRRGWTREEAQGMTPDIIEEKYDETRNLPYFVNLSTGQSGWTREAVMSKPINAAGGNLPDDIEKKFDPQRKLPYYINR